jgi:hypothetical protein
VIAFLIHVLCSCVAFACRMLGRYRHVGEKRPECVCEHATCKRSPFGFPECRLHIIDNCVHSVECEGRYVDRYGLLGAGLTDGGLDGFLSRWLGVNVWLQRIWRADGDRHMHDHPWHVAGSLILSGGYGEERAGHADQGFRGSPEISAGRVNLLPAGVYHRITAVRPRTWTLFITGRPHGRGWGFLVDGQHVPSFEYLIAAACRVPIGWATGTALRDVRKGEDVKVLSDQLTTVADRFARAQDMRDRNAIELMVGGYKITPLQQEAVTEFDRYLARMGRAVEIPITDEPLPDTLRNDGQPDTEREPSTRRKDGAP